MTTILAWMRPGTLAWAILSIYALSYPLAQAIGFNAEMKARTKGEHVPDWVFKAELEFYRPLGPIIESMPESILVPYRSYNKWVLETTTGLKIEQLVRIR